MRQAAALVLSALALSALALASGCGGGSQKLAWAGRPHLYTPPTLPHDRILTGQVSNRSGQTIFVRAADVRLVDARGNRVASAAIFAQSYAHRIAPFNRPGTSPPLELERKGIIARIKSGARVPFTVSWREPPGMPPPVRVEFGGGSLTIPR